MIMSRPFRLGSVGFFTAPKFEVPEGTYNLIIFILVNKFTYVGNFWDPKNFRGSKVFFINFCDPLIFGS